MEHRERRLNRRAGFDYGAPECYFVTLCTYNRQQLFEIEVLRSEVPLIPMEEGIFVSRDSQLANQIVHKWIARISKHFPNVKIRRYVIMPDHLHLVVDITEPHAGCSLPDVMRYFKARTTNEYITCVSEGALDSFDRKIWQKSYHDHIIRDYQDYHEIMEYIKHNPDNWIKMYGE